MPTASQSKDASLQHNLELHCMNRPQHWPLQFILGLFKQKGKKKKKKQTNKQKKKKTKKKKKPKQTNKKNKKKNKQT